MLGFVYIIDRDGELDVYDALGDAEEASSILGLPYVEQSVFPPSREHGITQRWLDELRKERTG